MTKFNIGDVVEITKESAETGLLDFTQGWPYRVHETRLSEYGGNLQVYVLNDSGVTGWYHENHFKLKESTVESNENHFKVGQTVWDVVYGKGEVVNVLQNVLKYPVVVKFVDGKRHFTEDGKLDEYYARTLFFSEPKIIAETKPLFEPTLKKGDKIIVVSKQYPWSVKHVIAVEREIEDGVVNDANSWLSKESWDFYRLGEKIEFN